MLSSNRRAFLTNAAAATLLPLTASSARAEQQSVTFLFDVLPNPKHALFYPAQANGYFRQSGLDVTIESGKGSADVVQRVASGAADIGFADASAVILGRSRGLPVKLVTMVHYKSLMSIVTRQEAGVATPKDLVGKKIAATSGDAVRIVLPALARLNGFDSSKVNFVTVDQAAKSALLMTGRVDGVCDYASAFPIYEAAGAQTGVALRLLLYADFGLDIYSNGIIVRDDTIRDKPQLVRAFVSAIIKSMTFAATDRAATIAIFRRFQPQYSEAVVAAGLDIAVAHLMVPEVRAHGIGPMSEAKMAQTIDVTKASFGLPAAVAPADAYTNAFIGAT